MSPDKIARPPLSTLQKHLNIAPMICSSDRNEMKWNNDVMLLETRDQELAFDEKKTYAENPVQLYL